MHIDNLHGLYDSLTDESINHNPFYSKETDRLWHNVYDKYISEGDDKRDFQGHTDLGELVTAEQRHAFEVGYKTAVRFLFMGLEPIPNEGRRN